MTAWGGYYTQYLHYHTIQYHTIIELTCYLGSRCPNTAAEDYPIYLTGIMKVFGFKGFIPD